LVLAIPEALGVGWLVTPLLGTLLLVLIGRIAREVFNPTVADAATVLTVLSPAFLANCAGRMPHALAGVIVAGATLACLQGIRTGRISRLLWMFALLVFGFHVRPFTTFLAAAVLGVTSLWLLGKDRPALLRVASLAVAASLVSIFSILAYNWLFTGQPLLSPYALQRGTAVPIEIRASLGTMVRNAGWTWRFSTQSMLLYSFPLLFPMAVAGYWLYRKHSRAVTLLAALFCAMVLGHFVQVESSSSVIGERYWFEAFFAVSILAAAYLVQLTSAKRLGRAAAMTAITGLVLAQAALIVAAAIRLDDTSEPRREVRQLAESYQHCHCVVFLRDNPPFFGEHLNLNGPDWQQADVFYAIDPGGSQRDEWATRLGRRGWVLLTFNPSGHRAETEVTHLN
jgi:hypothetical protein